MKKIYIIPATKVEAAVIEEMIASSITEVGGNSGLGLGDGETPGEADTKEDDFWEGDW
jgi:hypothetical protein